MGLIVRNLVLLLCFLALAVPAVAESELDVRLVVDISGSMKQNDPNNLRQPAVRLITEFLGEDTSAGVWTFGQYVNMLVPHGTVDTQWRELALSRVPQINSAGLRTNIGGALEVASDDFYRDQRRDNTHFILLTDGMVDIAPSSLPDAAERNRTERRRILETVVPRLAEKGARIHAIALSPSADLALLRQMAQATGGSASVAQTDQSLSRVFLEALNRARPSEEVPLQGSGFTIDDSVSEFTAVIFHGRDGGRPDLIGPSGASFSEATTGGASTGADAVRWSRADDYTIVTVENPPAGSWSIAGEFAEGTRVRIVSDLVMTVSDLPAYFFAGEELPLNVGFESEGQALTDPEFLQVMTVRVDLLTDDGRSGSKTLSKPGEVPEDGVYRDLISRLKQPGEYTFTVTADGGTFQRQSRQTTVLRPPVDVAIEGQGTGAQSRYDVRVQVNEPSLVADQSRVSAIITGPDGSSNVEPLEYRQSTTDWLYTLDPDGGSPGEYSVVIELEAESADGAPVTYKTAPVALQLPRDSASAEYPVVEAPDEPAPAEPGPLADEEAPAPGASENLEESPPQESIAPDLAALAETPEAEDPVVPWSTADQTSRDQASVPEAPGAADASESGGLLWWALGAGGVAALALGLTAWLVRRKRKGVPEADDQAAEDSAESKESEPEPEPEMSKDDVAEDEPPVPDLTDNLSDDDADAVIQRVMADAQVEEDTRPDQAEDDDEFSLEDLDLSESDQLPDAEGPDGEDGAEEDEPQPDKR